MEDHFSFDLIMLTHKEILPERTDGHIS